jgi:long-chain acyl-CoA synthetase
VVTSGGWFRWHPEARVFDAAGQPVLPAASGVAVSDGAASGAALAGALAQGAAGFRIGASHAPPPEAGPKPMFETLTSGSSTGQPRRIRRRQASWLASFAVNAGLFGIGPGVQVAVLGSLVQSLALYGALEGVCLGAGVHLLDGLRPDRQRQALAARRVEVIYATPAQLRLMTGAAGPTLPDLRVILVGGSKLDPALRRALAAMAPTAAVREFYGAAEASFITLADDETPQDAVGTPYPAVQIRVCGPAGGTLPDGESGEVWVKSPYLFDGYAGTDPGSAHWQDGWLSVGEIGRMERGMLYLAGRAGRMVTIADQNVFPEEVEAALADLPGVTRAAVLPRVDALRGTVLIAVLQGDAAQETAILRAARQSLGALKAPKAIIWLKAWPELPSGKTDLRQLAKLCGL